MAPCQLGLWRFIPALTYLRTAHEHHDLSVLDIEVELLDGAGAVWVDLGNVVEANAGHDECSAPAPSRASS
jgi:hypothetical protein